MNEDPAKRASTPSPKGATPDDFKYWAFISYSSQDAAWAAWLHRKLERYRLPKRLRGRSTRYGPVPARLYPSFRDREELPTSSNLSATITEALRASRALVVICSPDAADSKWVDQEVRTFRDLGRGDRISCFVVRGSPDAKPGAPERCFCPALTGPRDDPGSDEPLAADARRDGDGKSGAFLKLVAGLVGVDYGELRDRERSRRRARAVAGSFIVAAALLLSAWAAEQFAPPKIVDGPSGVLLMPFDATEDHVAFMQVAAPGDADTSRVPVATHWTFWGDHGALLADVFVCLGDRGSVILDPASVSSSGPHGNRFGPVFDLTGERGMAIVTAYEAAPNAIGCAPTSPPRLLDGRLVGEWRIFNVAIGYTWRNQAVRLAHGALPPASSSLDRLIFQTPDPTRVDDGRLVLLGVEEGAGPGELGRLELGPTRASVCCEATYLENIGRELEIPGFCIRTAQFMSFFGPAGLFHPRTIVSSSGAIKLLDCRSEGEGSGLGEGRFLHGFIHTSVGGFG